jgi:uncharacterized protein (DUF736 family)
MRRLRLPPQPVRALPFPNAAAAPTTPRGFSFRAPIDILLNPSTSGDTQPDYRVYSQAVEIGAGWTKKGKTSGEDYISLSLADPAFGPKKLYANLGRAAG